MPEQKQSAKWAQRAHNAWIKERMSGKDSIAEGAAIIEAESPVGELCEALKDCMESLEHVVRDAEASGPLDWKGQLRKQRVLKAEAALKQAKS